MSNIIDWNYFIIFLKYRNFQIVIGKNVAIKNDKNNSDCETNLGNISTGKIIPTSKLLEKSGVGNKRKPPINPKIIDMYAVFSFSCLLKKLQKTVSTNAQQNRSANKNKYNTLNPLEATINATKERAIIKYLESFK